jgi:hypothetical protein
MSTRSAWCRTTFLPRDLDDVARVAVARQRGHCNPVQGRVGDLSGVAGTDACALWGGATRGGAGGADGLGPVREPHRMPSLGGRSIFVDVCDAAICRDMPPPPPPPPPLPLAGFRRRL